MIEVQNLVLEHLRHIPDAVDHVHVDVRELRPRLGNLESPCVSMSNRPDGMDLGIEHVERRPGFEDA
ncbi:hypothetical protein [Bradyrhizobium aeschynomenes]|uniref:hypothetical protein n=1 Tax=Bradyrhizobium aeschynomenes TaxID=2734909 RepID=UPI0015562932|nr:hypothetical protein [Bradyrhizobium aeschynomenes]NPV20779.1 hypothetical protein [Bradyrhizobium aeschynomenes]